jgi:calcineurin-like phosphoesterase family protein
VIVTALAASLAMATTQVEEPATVWAVGDGADGSAIARQLARRIERSRPDAFLYLGDVYPGGTAEDYRRNWRPVYGRLDRITWPTPGNHEWWAREQGYFPYWRRHGRAKPWYRFNVGGWEVLSLNSETAHGPGSPQMGWLRRVLARGDTTCRIAFWHRPRFSPDSVHGDAPDIAPLWNVLQGHARLVLNGHGHVMARYKKRGSLTQYLAGTGGQVRYTVLADSRLDFARSDMTGALRLTLSPGRADLEFRAVNGQRLDKSSATCRDTVSVTGR